MIDDESLDWSPEPGETAEDYVERVGGWSGSNLHALGVLSRRFGKSAEEAKRLYLGSRSFWESFFREELTERHARGASRYGAINYVRRKCDWPDHEIVELVDSIGHWDKD